jgi:hypothetical protein
VTRITYQLPVPWESVSKTVPDGQSFISLRGRQTGHRWERAGFSVEQLIRLLNPGMSVDALLQIIAARLTADEQTALPTPTYFINQQLMPRSSPVRRIGSSGNIHIDI